MQLTAIHRTIASSSQTKIRIPAFIAIIALSDFLVFGHAPGLNLFLLFVSAAIAIIVSASRPQGVRRKALQFGLTVLAAAPLIEATTWSGLVIATSALVIVALSSARLLPKDPTSIPLILLRFLPAIPVWLPRDGFRYLSSQSGKTVFGSTLKSLSGWMLPAGLGLVFLLLFSAANPLIEMGLHQIDLAFFLQFLDIRRLLFWLLVGAVIWAMLRPRLIRRRKSAMPAVATETGRIGALLDHSALLRCLWVFNLLFALQTLLDLTYLWGGLDLPAGMSHAEYAHRGAYPLVATALLAAAFVLIAMRRGGPGDQSRLIRVLVIAWILQNVMLCLSSILRLDLYVETYSLTGLRIAAGIWMGLVAAGLVFILLKIAQRRSNQWLISMNLATLASVLYVVAFADISAFIARYNVENSIERGHAGMPLDIDYLVSLGPSAIPALDLFIEATKHDTSDRRYMAEYGRQELIACFLNRSEDWRSWTYRSYRMENHLRPTPLIER